MSDILEYFNDPDKGSQGQGDDDEFANVTGLVLGRNDSFHNREMGFKDPDNPSGSPSRIISVSQDPDSTSEPSPAVLSKQKQPVESPMPKPLDSYDFSYSADSGDQNSPERKDKEASKYRRQVSSPILDHLIDTLSDVEETIPENSVESSIQLDEDINDFMGSIPSNFDKRPAEKPKISPRLAEKVEERRKSSAREGNIPSPRESPRVHREPLNRAPVHEAKDEDPEDMAVIMANKEKKKKKKPSDSYMEEFEVVKAGKRPTHAADKDHDELDMKNRRPKKKKNNDAYLSDIPVVKVSDKKSSRTEKDHVEMAERRVDRRPNIPKEPASNGDRERNPAIRKGRVQKPANDNYLNDIPVVHAKKLAVDRENRSSNGEGEAKMKSPPAARSKAIESSPSERVQLPPPTNKKPVVTRNVDSGVVLPRLVQSDQTNARNKKVNHIGSQDDSNDYTTDEKPRKKKKKPLYMRLQQKALKQQSEIENEKLAAYALLREKKKLGQPSHQELMEHRQKYAELKKEEEARKKEAREFRENEWKRMQQLLEEKNGAVISHVPSSSPLKRNASNVGTDDESIHSNISHKKKKRPRRRPTQSEYSDNGDDEDSVVSGAARRQDDIYLPNIVSPAKLSPRGIGKARRAKRRDQLDDENQSPRHIKKNHNRDDTSDISHEDESHQYKDDRKQVRMRLPPESGSFSRPDPIKTDDSVDHVRFANHNSSNAASRKSNDSDNSNSNKNSMNVDGGALFCGPQYLAELLEPDQHEDDLAQMYETGFEMQMVERGMMETPSAAKALLSANNRIPRFL